ncbi:MAG: PQQ-binding-like beta-propeller repeat protein [Thermomicrobiales bacterium]
MTTRARRTQLAVVLLLIAQPWLFGAATARQDQELDFARDVLPAVVQIAVRVVESGGGVAPTELLVPQGSGTVIAPHGLVLTSAHVLDLSALIASAEARQTAYREQQGLDRTVRVIEEEYVLLFPLLPDEPPIPLYTAAAEQVDADLLDLAVLRITGGPKNQPVSLPDLRFVPLGDSDDLGRTDRIFVVGYPGIADTGIIDSGEVNSFETAPGISGRAWIITDATVSGGSSGGAAVDAAGRLIGVITLASALDCRPGDTNDDGVVDALDIGCVPVGSALARLRPINLAAPLLTAAGLATPAAETATPTPTATPSPTEPPAPTATPVLPTPTPTLAPPPTSTPAPPTSTPVPPTPTPTPLPVIAEPPATIPMYRGNPARTGEVPGPGPLGDPVSLWTFTTANWVHASPVAADQIVYIGSRDGNIYALDAFSGAERWRFPTSSGTQSTAAVVDGVVYVGGSDDTIFALDAFTGAELWRVPTGSSIVSSPAMVDGVVYFGNWDGILYALDAGSGAERWRFDTNASGGGAQSSIEASPAVVDGVVYIGNYAGNVYAIDAVTGEELWRSTVGHFVKATAAVSAGVAYVIDFDGNFEGAIHALDAGTGEELWRVPVGNFAVAAPAVAGGTVYVGDPAGYIVALDAATGTERWRVGTDFGVHSSPTVADGVVYVGSGLVPTTGALHAIDVATGEALWQVPAASGVASSPAVVAGIVYFGSYDGNVYAVAGSEFP